MSGLRASHVAATAALSFALSAACDPGPKQAPPPNAGGEAAPSSGAHAKPIGHDENPNGAHRAGVHGESPHAANPHGADMRVRARKPPGPPREVEPSGDVTAVVTQELSFAVPVEWESLTPGSRARLAEYVIPGPGGDASLKLYRFENGGGTAEANLGRWIGQMSQPDGTDSREKAVIDEAERDGLKFTRLDLGGNFAGQRLPGAPAVAPIDDARLLTLVVEGSNNPFFFKLVGPKKTVDLWADAFTKLAESAKIE